MTRVQLEVFSLLAELRGFTLVAQRLGISQSAVSHALKSLETDLGVPLLDRTTAQIEMTDIGVRLLPRAREVLGLTQTIRQEADDYLGLRQGSLRIGSFGPTSTLVLLPPILEKFHQNYPDIEVHIDEGSDADVVQWIQQRQVDLGFVVLDDERFETYPLLEDQLVALVPGSGELADHDQIELSELCQHRFIMTEAGSSPLIERLFSDAGLVPTISSRTSQVLSTMALVARDEGVAIVAESAIPQMVEMPGLAIRPLSPRHHRRVGLALLDSNKATPAARAFIEIAQQSHRR
ncbi:LysR family transcriptional regulator [Motiliproteus coralliicola]|uniref:LysR family transcriptional regulator n=1 Tax=Motiliproteus coralliicola TaxID=2283196 RepID=A0A369WKK8_9GAMM|nr:LysR family transcriptional regulator [Motiliproteus coralliicola]RDE22590.1 LysR family transcriptional regulator [Motiliproteus coralliicola]